MMVMMMLMITTDVMKDVFDSYFAFLVECKDPKACTILLRGASKDILNEVERNLQDAMNVARNVMIDPYLCPGGGATEMALAQVRGRPLICLRSHVPWAAKGLEIKL